MGIKLISEYLQASALLTELSPYPLLFFPHTHIRRELFGCPDKLDSQFLRSKEGMLRIGIQLLPLIGLD